MGYYSEIGLCLNKEANAKMFAELEKQSPEIKSEVQELLNSAQKEVANKDKENEAYLYYWPWIKWYENFPEVKFITDIIGKLPDDEDESCQYLFINVGENLDDNNESGNYYDNPFEIGISRGISFTVPVTETENKE